MKYAAVFLDEKLIILYYAYSLTTIGTLKPDICFSANITFGRRANCELVCNSNVFEIINATDNKDLLDKLKNYPHLIEEIEEDNKKSNRQPKKQEKPKEELLLG